ncbi:velvet factor-domain-containing protein [Phlebopus sp. FC_14]|nr:velvet factor-domain-containing protein [Phlebopus sp. FC_14]
MASDGVRRTTGSLIGRPIRFVSGFFQGKTIRAELVEIQKADLGRKYARVDRRPLDPPPVVQLKFYEVIHHGTDVSPPPSSLQYKKSASRLSSDVQTLGLLCNVDLFPVPPTRNQAPQDPAHSLDHRDYQQNLPPLSMLHRNVPQQLSPSLRPSRSGVLTHFCGNPITEDMKCTIALSGATFVQPAIIDYQGKQSLDLAVKVEGRFFLRYRCFDIFSRTEAIHDLPIQAECYGGAFRIYSTKEFPGLQPSTNLTKQLARWGVRLNTRETERKRKRKRKDDAQPAIPGRPPLSGSAMKARAMRGSTSEYE